MSRHAAFFSAAILLMTTATLHAGTQPESANIPAGEAAPAALFADTLATKLHAGVTAPQVAAEQDPALRALAEARLRGDPIAEYRLSRAEAYRPVESVAKELKTSPYSRFENPVGIRFTEGEELLIFVGETAGENIALKIQGFMEKGGSHTHKLHAGLNRIRAGATGNGYLEYFTERAGTAPVIPVHFAAGGSVVGFFDRDRHTDADWKKLLATPAADILDIRGRHVQLAYPVATLRKVCPDHGSDLIRLYDEIIDREQTIMGLAKYGKRPKNRMFGRVIWKGYMHADATGAAFIDWSLADVANPAKIPANAWGIAHEFGHVNQVRPGMRWVSTSEVTNNIYSACCNYALHPQNMRLEHEHCDAGDGLGTVRGGRFNAFLNAAVVAKEPWLCQRGPDRMKGYENGGDHFVKLTPLWQLQLYFSAAGFGNPDFYPDIFEVVRNTDESRLPNGRLQLNFMKNACDSAKQDLTDFFRTVGMLTPIDRELDDYSRGRLTITETDCAELTAYAKRYPKPASPVIHYLSADSVDAFKHRRAVTGTAGEGLSTPAKRPASRLVSHAVWKNAVAFETYAGDRLVRVTKVGTGVEDGSATLVAFPEGATRIEAVAWDGTRTQAFRK